LRPGAAARPAQGAAEGQVVGPLLLGAVRADRHGGVMPPSASRRAVDADDVQGQLLHNGRPAPRPGMPGSLLWRVWQGSDQAPDVRPDPSQRISPHKLRHTFASRLVAKGADIVVVRDLLGHSSIATTQIYLHCTPDRLRAAVDSL